MVQQKDFCFAYFIHRYDHEWRMQHPWEQAACDCKNIFIAVQVEGSHCRTRGHVDLKMLTTWISNRVKLNVF
ncbi:hypothetical protein Bca4012_021195 [Brassica carinata]